MRIYVKLQQRSVIPKSPNRQLQFTARQHIMWARYFSTCFDIGENYWMKSPFFNTTQIQFSDHVGWNTAKRCLGCIWRASFSFCWSSCRIWSVFMYTSFQANFFQEINSTPDKLPEPLTVACCFICTVLWVLAPCDSGTLQIPDAFCSFAKIRNWISSNEFTFWWCCLCRLSVGEFLSLCHESGMMSNWMASCHPSCLWRLIRWRVQQPVNSFEIRDAKETCDILLKNQIRTSVEW